MRQAAHKFKPIKIEGPVTLISQEEYESLLETMEILGDKKQLARIESALKNIRQGRFYTHEQVFGH